MDFEIKVLNQFVNEEGNNEEIEAWEKIKNIIKNQTSADLPEAGSGYALLDDVALKKINYFVYKYERSGHFDCPICKAVDECENWCIMPELIEIAEKNKSNII